MSTLKKIVSLTLALAMLMSVSVFADFADQAEIDKDAVASVNKLASVGILNGIENEDGTFDFNPTGTIKRAEAAKMIYVLHNKGVDDKAAIWADAVTFADCKDHWAAGYIAYCEAKNLISGRTETSFDPEAPVTGTELAKMLLTVAGYKADVEGYTGANWEKNVVADAEAAGLFTGVKFAITQPAPRQWAAKMFDNAFNADCAIYIGDYRVEGLGTTENVAKKFLNLETYTAVVVATETAKLTTDLEYKNAAKGYTTLRKEADGTKKDVKFVVGDDMIGQQVTVSANTATGKIYGITATGKTIAGVLMVTKNTETTGEKAGKYTVKVGDTVLTEKAAGTTKINPLFSTSMATLANVATTLASKSTATTYIAFDFDGDKDIDATYTITAAYGTVNYTETGSNKGQFNVKNGDTTLISVDKNGKVGDVVIPVTGTMKDNIVAKVITNGLTGAKSVEAAEVVVGAYTLVTGTGADAKFTVGGVQYQAAADKINTDWFTASTYGNLNKTALLYTDGKYVIMAGEFDPTDGAAPTELPNYAYVIGGSKYTTTDYINEFGKPDTLPEAIEVQKLKVLLSDGTVAIFDYEVQSKLNADADVAVSSIYDSVTGAVKEDIAGKIFEYSITSKGKLILKSNLTQVEDVEFYGAFPEVDGATAYRAYFAGTSVTYNKTKKVFSGVSNVMGSDNTVVFAEYVNKDGDTEYKIVKLTDVMAGQNITMKMIASTDDTIGQALVVLAHYEYKASSSTPYVLVTSAPVQVKEGTTKYIYFNAVDLKTGETKEYKGVSGLYTTIVSGGIFKLAISNGVAQTTNTARQTWINEGEDTTHEWTQGAVQATVSGIVVIDGTLYDLTADVIKDAKVVVKNGSEYALGTLADLTVAATSKKNVLYVMADGEFTNILIDADGNLENVKVSGTEVNKVK